MAQGTIQGSPVVAAQLANSLGLGGTERQLVEHLRQMEARYSPRLMCLSKVGAFIADARTLSLEPEEFPLRGRLLQPNTALQIMQMARRLREERAQLLHCHDFYSNLVGSAAARLAGIPYIVSRRDLGLNRSATRRRLLTLATRLAPHVLCNAAAVRDLVIEQEGVAANRVTVVFNGLDIDRFDREAAPEPSPNLPGGEGTAPTIVLVGNMQLAIKGHAEFLLAAAAVARAQPAVRFLLVGDGVLRPDLERRAQEMGIGDRATFVGWRTDVPSLLARCTIAVSASHTEGLSNAIMEAMAARLPVVATGVGGNAELVQDGRTGFIVRSRDPNHMAARLVELLEAPQRAREMGLAGRRRLEAGFAASLLGTRMAALYDGILQLRPQVRRAA